MDKIDLKKQFGPLYAPKAGTPVMVQVPEQSFLMIDGQGDPNTSSAYQEAVQALFSLSYALKFKVKKGAQAIDYGVMPLEGLWWADDLSSFASGNRSAWQWTMMILQPSCVTAPMFEEMLAEVRRKKPLAALDRIRFARFEEGRCAQVLHIGPFTNERATIEALHAYIATSGSALRGRHHEIYLSDIQRTQPSKWKTILRQPIA